MTLPPIDLDSRDFQALVDEARALIPRLAPIWTDHNVSDPGITFLELLAWIADQQIYRVGHVGGRHHRAFAALLGVRPAPPKPARGLIWPDASIPFVHSVRSVRAGTVAVPMEQPEVSFVVDLDQGQEILLTPARRIEASAQVSGRQIDLQASFQAPQASIAFTPRRVPADSGLIELVFDQPLVRLPAVGPGEAIVSLGIEVPSRPVASPQQNGASAPWGPLQFDYRIGSDLYQPVTTVSDGTFALSVTGVVLVRLPAAAEEVTSSLRLRLDQGYFPVAPEISRITLNVLPVCQVKEVPGAPIGKGSGLPDQTIELPELSEGDFSAPGFGIQTEEQGELVDWQITDDVCRHAPADRVYRLEPQRRRLVFGNGINGMVPGAEAPIHHRAFRRTEGRRGNLAAGLPWRVDGIAIEGAYGRNPAPITGGEDASDAEQLAAAARAKAHRRDVLLSDDDLRAAATALPGLAVGRAEVIRRFYPQLPGRETPGARTLVVMPWRRAEGDPRQSQTAAPEAVPMGYPRAIAQALALRRLIGERLSVISARYVRLRVEAALLMADDRDQPAVIAATSQALNARLTDIPVQRNRTRNDNRAAGPETANGPWPLGRPVTLTEIETVLMRVPGVRAVLGCRLAWEDQPFAIVDIVLARDEVAVGGDHVLSAHGETEG